MRIQAVTGRTWAEPRGDRRARCTISFADTPRDVAIAVGPTLARAGMTAS